MITPGMLRPVWDGDQGAIREFNILSDAASAVAAVEWAICTEDGVDLATRPGTIVSRSSTALVARLHLKGSEAGWDGLGTHLIVRPCLYLAMAPDGSPATNVLTNSGFDTDTTPANGIADGWTIAPATTGTYAVGADDPAPGVISGSYQSVNPLAGTATEYIYQETTPGGGILVGDRWSAGVWFRGDAITGAASDGHALILELLTPGSETNIARFPVGVSDWRHVRAAIAAAQAGNTKARLKLQLNNSNLGSRRFDEAWLFKGEWSTRHPEAFRMRVNSRPRVPKTVNQLQGIGGFEQDSNADGIADWFSLTGAANTYTLEQDPAHVAEGFKSQKVLLAGNAAAQRLYLRHRDKYKAGDVWQASVKIQNTGALSGAPAATEFGIELLTEAFDTTLVSAATAFPLGSTPAFTTVTVQITLAVAANVLLVRLNLSKAGGGSAWLDDLQLVRTVAGP